MYLEPIVWKLKQIVLCFLSVCLPSYCLSLPSFFSLPPFLSSFCPFIFLPSHFYVFVLVCTYRYNVFDNYGIIESFFFYYYSKLYFLDIFTSYLNFQKMGTQVLKIVFFYIFKSVCWISNDVISSFLILIFYAFTQL